MYIMYRAMYIHTINVHETCKQLHMHNKYTCCIVSIDGGGFLLRHKLDIAQVILRRWFT